VRRSNGQRHADPLTRLVEETVGVRPRPAGTKRAFLSYARELDLLMRKRPRWFEEAAGRVVSKHLRRGLAGPLLWELGHRVAERRRR